VKKVGTFLETKKVVTPKVIGHSQVDGDEHKIPLLVRSDLTKVGALLLTDKQFVLFIGETGFGKSTTVELALAGTYPLESKKMPPVMYVKFRKESNFWEHIAIAFGIPYGMYLKHICQHLKCPQLIIISYSDKAHTSSEFILSAIESSLIQRRENNKSAPVAVFDDIHNVLMQKRSTPADIKAASDFCTWLLEQQKDGLICVKFFSSKPDVKPILKNCKSWS
jgi:energy-coupling factor transporter ATP-binding protein EcfA2